MHSPSVSRSTRALPESLEEESFAETLSQAVDRPSSPIPPGSLQVPPVGEAPGETPIPRPSARAVQAPRANQKTVRLKAVGLGKRYRGTEALRDFSLTLYEGEIFGLMGPNGAGKTTLLRILATLTQPDSGTYELDGIPFTQTKDLRLRLGFTNDVLGVYDDMLVGEYLEFFARAGGVERRQVPFAVEEVLVQVGLLPQKEQPVDGLSRGMKQRLAFARAVVTKPKLLLLDEPASGLDPLARLELKELLLGLARRGTTVVLSSHVLEDLAEVSHRIGVIRNGILLKVMETEKLIDLEGSRRFRLQVADRPEADKLYRALAERRDVGGLRWDRSDLVFRWVDPASPDRAHPGESADLLCLLVGQGFRISGFQEEKATLENAYLHIAGNDSGRVS